MTAGDRLLILPVVCSGDFRENCYVVAPADGPPGARPCWIVDPGAGAGAVIEAIEREGLAPDAIVLTHGHFDHIAGIPEIRARWPGLPIWIGRLEADALQSPGLNMSGPFGMPMRLDDRPDRLIDQDEELALGPLRFRAILTPGHSPGGLCLYFERSGDLFTGDALLAGSIGRSDTTGGDGELLVRSIREKLFSLPDRTRVWPGHGPGTTIAQERRSNPFVKVETSNEAGAGNRPSPPYEEGRRG